MSALRSRGWVLGVLLAVVVPLTTSGCFGRFELTRKFYRFNRDISSDKWIRWFTFLVMAFVPVYLIGGLVDLILGNSLEFWGGQSPFAAGAGGTRYAFGPNGEVVAVTPLEPGVVLLQVTDADETRTLRVVREADSMAAYDEHGKLLARVGERGGVPVLLEGAPVR
jgi:hypothetical protein